MAIQCQICGKRPSVGHSISHSNIKNKRRWMPNLQRVRVQIAQGANKYLHVCTRCIRSNKVKKAV